MPNSSRIRSSVLDQPEYLLSSARLAEFRSWSSTSGLALNDQERDFLAASEARVAREREAAALRQRDEATARLRLWVLVGALRAALGVAALFIFGVFGDAGDRQPITFFGNRSENSWNADAGFLAGAAAALKTETSTVGFIGTTRNPVIEQFQAGFEAGARASNSADRSTRVPTNSERWGHR